MTVKNLKNLQPIHLALGISNLLALSKNGRVSKDLLKLEISLTEVITMVKEPSDQVMSRETLVTFAILKTDYVYVDTTATTMFSLNCISTKLHSF